MRDTLQACLCSESSQDWKEVSVSALCLHFRSTAKAPFPSFVVHVLGHLTFGSSLSQSVQAFSTELGIALKFSSSSIISPNFSQLDTHFQLPLRLPSKRNMRCLSSYALQMDQRPLSWLPDSWRFCRWYLWQALRPVSWIPPYALADTPGKHSLLWLSEFSWSSISHSPEAPCFLTLAGIDLRQHREGLWCRGQLPRRGMAGTVPGPPSPSADHFLPSPMCIIKWIIIFFFCSKALISFSVRTILSITPQKYKMGKNQELPFKGRVLHLCLRGHTGSTCTPCPT